MATVRLIVVVLVLGLVVLLGVQNLAQSLPLVFLGIASQPLPLGVWLVGAVLLGALTTLALTALLGAVAGPGRAAAYKYRPQSFYEPTDSRAAAPPPRSNTPPPYSSPASGRSPSTPPSGSSSGGRGDGSDDDPSWRDWTNLTSPAQWSDWESLSQAPKPEMVSTGAPTAVDSVLNWFSTSRRQAFQQRRVSESIRELDDDWGELENRRYAPRGVSPVEDTLEEIDQGWDSEGGSPSFEATQAPRRVYRDGSLYSYSYRDEGSATDNIYAPPDDVVYRDDPVDTYGDSYPLGGDYDSSDGENPDETYDNQTYGSGDYPEDSRDLEADRPLGEPEIAEDGVVDADYRVIELPFSAAAEAAATAPMWTEGSDGAGEETGDRDEWDETDDVLTP